MDLNCDLGEGFGVYRIGDDEALLAIVSSANIACGFHAGDPTTMARTVTAAASRGVAIGAQVSYPDLVGFGRRRMDLDPDDLTADVLYQLGALTAFAVAAGAQVRYVKAHGALYNRIVDDREQAGAVVAAIRAYDATLPLLTLPGSVAAEAATSAGIPVLTEGYADRTYRPDGRLAPRTQPGAVITDAATATQQAVRLAEEGRIQSICVHGDTPGAVALAQAVRAGLLQAGFPIEPAT